MTTITRVWIVAALAAVGCSDSSSATPDGGGTDGDGVVVGPPTASSWMSTNVAGDLPWTDITHQLSGFDTPVAQRDANGYPAAGASGTSSTDLGFVLPSGSYKVSYRGTGTLAVSGIAALDGAWQTVGDEHRATLTITGAPGQFGRFLTLAVTNASGQAVTDVHVYAPGIDYDPAQTFHPQFLALLAPFRMLRFMDWEGTNNSTVASWTDRPTATQFGAGASVPFERIAELLTVTGKDGWITIPEHATDDYIQQLAQLLVTRLDFAQIAAARRAQGITTPFQLVVEPSNETWNQGFTAFQTYLTAANANPGRYTGVYDGTYGPAFMSSNVDLMKVGQYEADRLVKIAEIFRAAFGERASMIAPVLSGWALGAAYSDVGLRFIRANYGEPKLHVGYVAQAPYFGAPDAQTGSLDSLFAALRVDIQAMDATFADFARLGAEYEIPIAAYEGGQGLTGTTNQTIKHLAQHDQRMYDAYNAYFALWKQHFGKSLFCHFQLAGTPGVPEFIFQYGYWGSIISTLEDPATCGPALPTLTGTESIDTVVHHCPKYRALAEQALE